MAKLGSVLERQFKKLGIAITDEVKALLELDTEVPDDVAGQIDKGLMTMDAAKNNPDLIKQFKQSVLAGADAKMDDIIKEVGITVDELFANEKNTYEKIAMLAKAAVATGTRKAEADNKAGVSETLKKEREAFAAKEAEYNRKLAEKENELTAKVGEFSSTRENDLTSFELQKLLLGKDYVFPKEMDSSLKVETALSAVNKDLMTKGLKIKRNEAGQLVITDKDGNAAYNEKHEAYDNTGRYIDGVLTHNKMLNINDPNAQQQQQQQGGSGGIVITPGGGTQGNPTVLAEIDAQISSMK